MSQPELTAVLAPDALPAYSLNRRGPALPPAEDRRAGLRRADVERIIAERQFTLAFQPIVRLADRRAVHHEALLRLHPPEGVATLAARPFVDVAGGWGLGAALDSAVLDAALTAWGIAGGTPVAVNVAARSLSDAAFVQSAIARIGGEGAALLVEVMAASALDSPPAFAEGVAALQEAGVRVCLDDLGGDPAALDIVRLARFDLLKLDGETVRAAAAGGRGRRLLAALVALANAAGAGTVAKHIETLPQAWLMQELGVRYGQGWLFGAPGALPGGL